MTTGHDQTGHNGRVSPQNARHEHRRQSLEDWALDLAAPVQGHLRKAYAPYKTIAAAVGSAIVQGLIEAGMLEVWELGPGPTATPWGIETGRLVCLTPLGAAMRGVRLAERTARCVTGHRTRGRHGEQVQLGEALVPYWESATRPERPIMARHRESSGPWLELIADPRTGDD
jgi:hypothetical protein